MKTAVIMSRVSSEEQALGYSLGVQEESLTRYCEKNNILIVHKFREDHSAKDFNRPAFKLFLTYARKNKGKIDYFLITSWDRFSRNITDAFLMIRTLKNLGITVQAIEQQTDMSIPENIAMLALFLAIPEIDNERRSIKIKGGMQAALKAGRWCRKAPRGYRNSRDEENKPMIVPGKDAIYIKSIFEGVAAGKSQEELRISLKKEGYEISKTNVSALLRNPVYIGKIRVPAGLDQAEQIVEGLHQGLINEGTYYRVQNILNGNLSKRNMPKFKTIRSELLLRGNLNCSKCGDKLTGSPSRGKLGTRYFYYHCNHCGNERYRADMINEKVKNIISELQFNREAKEVYREMIKMLLMGTDADRTRKVIALQKDLEKQNQRLSKIQDLYIDGSLSNEDYSIMRQRYSGEKVIIEDQLKGLREVKSNLNSSLEKGVGVLANLDKMYERADLQGKKQILGSIFPENLTFDGKKCRTPRINEVLRLILLIDNEKQNKKSGQIYEFLEMSAQVTPPGFE